MEERGSGPNACDGQFPPAHSSINIAMGTTFQFITLPASLTSVEERTGDVRIRVKRRSAVERAHALVASASVPIKSHRH